MELKDLVVYDWNNFSRNSLSETEIKYLLGQNLFRLNHRTIQDEVRFPASGTAQIFFVCEGTITIIFNSVSYTILPNKFLQIPKGHREFTCSSNTVFYQAFLTRDIPLKIINSERAKFPEVHCHTTITHSMEWWHNKEKL